jgi:hypothetical protein
LILGAPILHGEKAIPPNKIDKETFSPPRRQEKRKTNDEPYFTLTLPSPLKGEGGSREGLVSASLSLEGRGRRKAPGEGEAIILLEWSYPD